MDIESKTKSQQYYGKLMAKKWEKALNADGGIADQRVAEQTAIILENYMQYLNKNPQLIAEDQAESGDFVGVNLALLGVLRRVIPDLVAATELVGMQAMATPQSPIFYLSWVKSLTDTVNSVAGKGSSNDGEELWGYPSTNPATDPIGQTDAYLSSSQVKSVDALVASAGLVTTAFVPNASGAGTNGVVVLNWRPVVKGTIVIRVIGDDGSELERVHIAGSYASGTPTGTQVYQSSAVSGGNILLAASCSFATATFTVTVADGDGYTIAGGVTIDKVLVEWEYIQEGNEKAPQLTPTMTETTLRLIRRMLKGKFSIDSETDSRAYWGIDLERELSENMKVEIMNEVSREIIGDLRLMAAISKTVDYNDAAANNVIGNYDDTAKFVLDVLSSTSSEIWNQGRLGPATWLLGNPSTLSVFDRVTGIQGSGASYNGSVLSYSGSIGNKYKMYSDPQFPKGEILMGRKGPGASDTGYVYAPYQLIQPTPTMNNYETGDSVKIFYTRYGKTFERINPTTGNSLNHIFRGEYNYAKITLQNFPSLY